MSQPLSAAGRWTLAVCVLILFGGVDFAAAKDERPNILYIMSDDHGWQAIGAYGSQINQTPNIDRIANEGMRFDRFFITNSICGPSRAVMLTGKYSHLNGFVRNGNRFNGQQQHVGKLLQKAGYQTAVIGKWHLETEPTGFDHYHILIGQGPYYNPPMLTPQGRVQHTGYTTDIITDLALEWLQETRDPEKPFFLMYQHKAPHRDWQPSPKHLNLYDDVEIPEPETLFDDYSGRGTAAKVQEMTIERHLTRRDLKLDPPGNLTQEQAEAWHKAYDPKNEAFEKANLQGKDLVRWKYQRYAKDYLRCVTSVDENIGRVLDYLDASGLAKNTVVVYTSDQGWWLGEHGWYDKRWMYEESFRTPLVVRWPDKIKPGSVNNDMTLNLDFAETFLDLAGAEIPDDMQGRSLTPLFAGKRPDDWRTSVYYHYYEYPGPHMVHKHYGARTDRYKLIHFYELKEWELYDLKEDPREMKSVYDDPKYAEVVQEMKQELARLREQYKDDGSVVDFGAQQARQVRLQLVAAFPGEEGDSSGGFRGSLIDTPHGKGARLSGDGAAASFPGGNRLDPSNKPLAVGAWCKPAKGDGVIAAQGGESLGWSLYLESGKACFAVRRQGQLVKVHGPSVPVGEWTHLAATLDADGNAQLRIGGEPAEKSLRAGLIPNRPADALTVGADTGSLVSDYDSPLPLTGELADVRVYWGELPQNVWRRWTAAR